MTLETFGLYIFTSIMNCEIAEKKIAEFQHKVDEQSYGERLALVSYEERVNKFLDGIIELRKHLTVNSDKLEILTDGIEDLTHLTGLNEDCLKAVSSLIASCNDLIGLHKRLYVRLNSAFRTKGIARGEIKRFKRHIEDFEESVQDLELVFFVLPSDEKFQTQSKRLSNLG